MQSPSTTRLGFVRRAYLNSRRWAYRRPRRRPVPVPNYASMRPLGQTGRRVLTLLRLRRGLRLLLLDAAIVLALSAGVAAASWLAASLLRSITQ